jgi:MFS superfamily sulfate permease-like transporter
MDWLRFNLMAGFATAAVIVPKAMAYAAISGLPLVVGLYTSLVMLVVYAVFGTSRLCSLQDMVYSSSSTSFTLSNMVSPITQGGCHAMDGHHDDGAEPGVHQ